MQELVNIIWACAKLGYHPGPLMHTFCTQIGQMVRICVIRYHTCCCILCRADQSDPCRQCRMLQFTAISRGGNAVASFLLRHGCHAMLCFCHTCAEQAVKGDAFNPVPIEWVLSRRPCKKDVTGTLLAGSFLQRWPGRM